ncbi:MAG TPA: hypothetical protein VFI39_10480 [Gemmatimonadales bacterium]|nr:hypothetical protein [Gemmatimonadales bacterium]
MKTITIGLIAGAMLLGPGRAGAQDTTADSLPPLNCPEVARIARDTTDGTVRGRMYATLALCPNEASAVYADAWRDATLSDAVLSELPDGGGAGNDRLQVLAAMLSVAQSPTRSDFARLLALRGALHFVSPSITFDVAQIVQSHRFSGLRDSPSGRSGPDDTEARAQVLQALADLAARGDGGLVTEVARKARAELAYTYPGDTPLRPGALSAHWDCRGSLALANRGDVSIALRVVDSSGATLAQLSLPPGAGTGPKGYGIAVYSPGPLTLYMGTQLLQRLGCPAPAAAPKIQE